VLGVNLVWFYNPPTKLNFKNRHTSLTRTSLEQDSNKTPSKSGSCFKSRQYSSKV